MKTELKMPELFASMVFDEETMKARLSVASYESWKTCVTNGETLDISTANEIAEAMKQWAVELGATRIVPVISDRCIVRLPPAERAAKAERWRRIAADAARQSDAVWLPEVLAAVDFSDSLERVKSCGRVFAGALCKPPPPPIWNEVAAVAGRAVPSLGIFVGPEGDFTPDELRALLELATPVSFGPTILRAETAAIFGLSVLAAAGAALPD